MSTAPVWALSLIYWLHMLATVIWIGGLATLSILVLPSARRVLDITDYAKLLMGIRRKLDPLGWLSLLVLLGTGMFQMSVNPNYGGFLAVNNQWAVAILVKHIVFLLMASISAYLTWGIIPKLSRLAFRQAEGQDTAEAEGLRHREALLMRINLILGAIVLALTALARAS
jgi:uncharacterized membrane protein